ncbi:MAG: type II/IV secretion system protein, partial [Gammaproteobacteria bacterium]
LECRNTGYKGRIGLYEMLGFSPAIKKLIAGNFDIDALRQEAVRGGMKPLRLRGAQKVAEGVTTVDEVLRVVPSPTTHY